MKHVRDHSASSGPTKSVLLMIAMRANEEEDHTCYPGVPRLAQDSGFSERTVKAAIRWGVENEEISVIERGGFRGGIGRANLYRVEFKVHELPIGNVQETPIDEPLRAARAPQRAGDAPCFGHLTQVEGAALAPQAKGEPQVAKPEEEKKDTPLTPLEGGNALSPEFQTYLDKCSTWLDGEEPEYSGQVMEEFHSRREEGHELMKLVSAFRGACAVGDTDLLSALDAERIEDHQENDPIRQGWKRSAA